ncbi:MAG: NYN domain-containing protein [Ignavibacteriaceae bacterium]|nr:NYN domain-containing protein [Ignavibacteriaceae bacterium]
MRHYIIDGNNLIGKIGSLQKLQNKNKQSTREKLAFKLEDYFHDKPNIKVSLHLDGFPGQSIKVQNIRIIYSGKKTADDEIKSQIGNEKNPRNVILVSSDRQLKDFASVCGCDCISSEDFSKSIMPRSPEDEEQKRQDELNNDDFKKLFGV